MGPQICYFELSGGHTASLLGHTLLAIESGVSTGYGTVAVIFHPGCGSYFSEQQATRAKIARFLSQQLAWVKTHGSMEKGNEGKLLEREGLNSLSTDKEGGSEGSYHNGT